MFTHATRHKSTMDMFLTTVREGGGAPAELRRLILVHGTWTRAAPCLLPSPSVEAARR